MSDTEYDRTTPDRGWMAQENVVGFGGGYRVPLDELMWVADGQGMTLQQCVFD